MLINVPVTATPEEQRAFKEVNDLLEVLLGGFNVDWKGRRIFNAGDAQADQDYVTRADVVRMIRAAGLKINNDGSPIGSTGQTTSKQAASFSGGGTTLASELARVSLRA